MNVTLSKTGNVRRVLLVDALLLSLICAVPALSHIVALPLYKLNPMTLCLLSGMLMVSDKRNAYLLALLLPLVSMLVSGMPTPMKCVCMVGELLAIVGIYDLLSRVAPVWLSVFASLLSGKIVYYALKVLIVSPSVLVGTTIWLQLATLVVYGGAFVVIRKFLNSRE